MACPVVATCALARAALEHLVWCHVFQGRFTTPSIGLQHCNGHVRLRLQRQVDPDAGRLGDKEYVPEGVRFTERWSVGDVRCLRSLVA